MHTGLTPTIVINLFIFYIQLKKIIKNLIYFRSPLLIKSLFNLFIQNTKMFQFF